jgi:ATP-dependent Lhr-like helicase
MAPTGAGKTEAALLPVLSLIEASGGAEPVAVLYITPMKALMIKIKNLIIKNTIQLF